MNFRAWHFAGHNFLVSVFQLKICSQRKKEVNLFLNARQIKSIVLQVNTTVMLQVEIL